jgi:hypothetical protein
MHPDGQVHMKGSIAGEAAAAAQPTKEMVGSLLGALDLAVGFTRFPSQTCPKPPFPSFFSGV